MPAQKPREIAVCLLQLWENGAGFLDDLLDETFREQPLPALDRKLLKELTYGTLRWRLTLDWLIDRHSMRTQKLAIRLILRLGLYQLFWLTRIPDHAVVHESVEMARQLGFGPQSGFVNAFLRRYIRERDPTRKLLDDLKGSQPSVAYSHPGWLCARWEQRWGGERLRQLLEWNNRPPPTFARLNRFKCGPEQLAAAWEKEGIRAAPWSGDWAAPGIVYQLVEHPPFAECPSFQNGFFYLQDPSTLLAVESLKLEPGHAVLDLCAAPGGKATYAAQLLGGQGRVVAREFDPARLALLEENCRRLGVEGLAPELISDAPVKEASFDRVLVDAPCSNSGVMRRRVDLRWRIREEEIARLQSLQGDLLRRGADELKPGGLLVYSTCSLEPEENGQVVRQFLAERPDYRLEMERELQPFQDEVDGAYVARLRKE